MTTMIRIANGPLADSSDGQVLYAGDPRYDRARAVWNAMVDRHPRMIVRCASAADVAAAVRYARESHLEIGVRCGGHSIVGYAVPDDGLMIDLTRMGSVRVDPRTGRAFVQGGALLGALDLAAQRHGLATTAGNVSHTGVGGLTLGGGMGWLARQYGLACDNVLSYELVTADGAMVRTSAVENPDLFWGLRGGGGNFGIVTQFEFGLHEVPGHTLVATFSHPVEDATPVLRGWRDLSVGAPRQATFTADVSGDTVSVGFVWVGDPQAGRALVPAMRALGRPVAEHVEEMSYVALQRVDDSTGGHSYRRYWKGHYFNQLTDEALRAFLLRGTAGGSGEHLPSASLQAYGGAIAEVPDSASAFSHRDTAFEFVGASRWDDPDEDESWIAAARRYGSSLDAFASGAYVNTLNDEGSAGVGRAYPAEKLARLTALKDAYDPDNVFHLNQNIRPTSRV